MASHDDNPQLSHQAPQVPVAPLGLAVLALFVAAVNLRPAIAAVSPLVEQLRSDMDLSSVGVALLTTLPTLAMGVFAPLAAAIGRRWGLWNGILIGLIVIGIATGARGLGSATWLQMSSAAAVGVGIALTQTLLPAVVKARFAHRASLMTGVYTAALGLGGAVAAGLSAPLAQALGSWPWALASWSVLAAAGIVVWTVAKRSLGLAHVEGPKGVVTSGLPWRSGLAWRVVALSAGNSVLYYCELAWIAPLLYENAGFSEQAAGIALTIMISIQVVAMLAAPLAFGERADRRFGLAITVALTAIGFAGFALAPATGTWLWIAAVGIGHGGLFTLVLALPVAVAAMPDQASRLSAMAFFLGYACAAIGPVFVGALRDASGNFQLAFVALMVATMAMLLPIRWLSPSRIARTGPDL